MLSGLANGALVDARVDGGGRDLLTGLVDADAFALALVSAKPAPASLLLVDLDGFKSVNRRWGYSVGDRILRQVAVRLRRHLPPQALAARVDGDRFVVLLPTGFEPAEALTFGHDMLSHLAVPVRLRGIVAQIGASVGMASRSTGHRSSDLLHQAERALCEAKRAGGGCCRVFDPLSRPRPLPPDDLTEALARGEWELHYQPQYRLPERRLVGAEALLRRRHPRHGLVGPSSFLSDLERHPTASAVGRWVIRQACRDLALCRREGLDLPQISVNLFPSQLRGGGLRDDVADALARNGLHPGDLELEITERAVLDPAGEPFGDLHALRRDGVQIALDDFGTGFACFSTLQHLPISCLKIDRSFVGDLRPGSTEMAVVRAMLALGRDLHLRVVVEGVETQEQTRRLLRMGCRVFQGHHFGAALSAEAFALARGD